MKGKLRPLDLIVVGVIMAVAAVFILSGCGEPNVLTSGKVIDKNYDDADDWYVAGYTIDGGQSCSGGYTDSYGNRTPQICTDNPDTVIPGHYEHDDAHWALRIEGPLRDGKPPLREWHQVSQGVYDAMHIGDRWEK